MRGKIWMTENLSFGGDWTDQKLGCIRDYLTAWAQVMKRQDYWRTRYIDAFSGTGNFTGPTTEDAETSFQIPLSFDVCEMSRRPRVFDGSVQIALDIEPHFDQLDLVELNPQRVQSLRELRPRHANQKIVVHEGDANKRLTEICQRFDPKTERAVLFLDPFGCQVDWSTLEAVAHTEAIDVWYLFPAFGINRMLAHDPRKIPDGWARRLTQCLGTDEWQAEFYKPASTPSLFPDALPETTRVAGSTAVEEYFLRRLGSLFAAVAPDCVRLINSKNSHMFSLCFAIANPSSKAKEAALRIAASTIKKWEARRNGRH